jgi:hypothetical protein
MSTLYMAVASVVLTALVATIWLAVSRARRVWAMQQGASAPAAGAKACAGASCGGCASEATAGCSVVSVHKPVRQHLQ